MQPNVYAIIVAGGTGTRMNSEIPKQFIKVAGKPIIVHAIDKFYQAFSSASIIVVVADEYKSLIQDICENYFPTRKILTAQNGDTRYQSVKNGLGCITNNNSIVAIHDAVRPCVSLKTITETVNTAFNKIAAIPVMPIEESLRKVDGDSSKSVLRSNYYSVQTPQCFETKKIKDAYSLPYNASFTDDASVYEAFGGKVELTKGNKENIKVTTPTDLSLVNLFLND